MMQRVSEIAKQILKEKFLEDGFNWTSIAYGDLNELYDIFETAKMKVKIDHPLNRNAAVLNALDRESKRPDAIFIKEYFRSFKGLARMFTLKSEGMV